MTFKEELRLSVQSEEIPGSLLQNMYDCCVSPNIEAKNLFLFQIPIDISVADKKAIWVSAKPGWATVCLVNWDARGRKLKSGWCFVRSYPYSCLLCLYFG